MKVVKFRKDWSMSISTSLVIRKNENEGIVPYLFSTERITKKQCKICMSEFRDEIEGWYDSGNKNYNALQRRIKKEKFDISVPAIRNHFIYHHNATHIKENLVEYAEEIQKWVNSQTDKVSALRTRLAILEREMVMIASAGEDLPIHERRKNAETIKKLAEIILLYEEKLSKYQEELKPVNIIFHQLKIIITDEIENVNNSETKSVLIKIFERLQEKIGDIIIE